eukprot:GHVQ01032995.1.p1 GENE.GHVQ01032995.1~~GHVQ01032995.1.p1  ORF type:complete len:954 (+),score=60.04 GHVQ01032995.1:270-3131(+)
MTKGTASFRWKRSSEYLTVLDELSATRLYLVSQPGPLSFQLADELSQKFRVTIGRCLSCSCSRKATSIRVSDTKDPNHGATIINNAHSSNSVATDNVTCECRKDCSCSNREPCSRTASATKETSKVPTTRRLPEDTIAEHCVHTVFVIRQVLRVPESDPIGWQVTYGDADISKLLSYKTTRQLPVAPIIESGPTNTAVKRISITPGEDICPICQNNFKADEIPPECDSTRIASSSGPPNSRIAAADGEQRKRIPASSTSIQTSITFCSTGCGSNVHVLCMKVWADHKKSVEEPITCPSCRCKWDDSSLQQLRKQSLQARLQRRVKCTNSRSGPGTQTTPDHFSLLNDESKTIQCSCCHKKLDNKILECQICNNYVLCEICFHNVSNYINLSSYSHESKADIAEAVSGAGQPTNHRRLKRLQTPVHIRHPFAKWVRSTEPVSQHTSNNEPQKVELRLVWDWQPAYRDVKVTVEQYASAKSAALNDVHEHLQHRDIQSTDYDLLLQLDRTAPGAPVCRDLSVFCIPGPLQNTLSGNGSLAANRETKALGPTGGSGMCCPATSCESEILRLSLRRTWTLEGGIDKLGACMSSADSSCLSAFSMKASFCLVVILLVNHQIRIKPANPVSSDASPKRPTKTLSVNRDNPHICGSSTIGEACLMSLPLQNREVTGLKKGTSDKRCVLCGPATNTDDFVSLRSPLEKSLLKSHSIKGNSKFEALRPGPIIHTDTILKTSVTNLTPQRFGKRNPVGSRGKELVYMTCGHVVHMACIAQLLQLRFPSASTAELSFGSDASSGATEPEVSVSGADKHRDDETCVLRCPIDCVPFLPGYLSEPRIDDSKQGESRKLTNQGNSHELPMESPKMAVTIRKTGRCQSSLSNKTVENRRANNTTDTRRIRDKAPEDMGLTELCFSCRGVSFGSSSYADLFCFTQTIQDIAEQAIYRRNRNEPRNEPKC